ncbi:MAG: hypothetical protein HKN63_06150 [Rhodobacteraceae bacterium]|nr:hypothetical protein [Paracoccaceae bacterium]
MDLGRHQFCELWQKVGLIALISGCALSVPAFGDPLRCDDEMFTVISEDRAITEQLCIMPSQIRDELGACGLLQNHALTIEVTPELSHPMGKCLAYYDCEFELIRITDPATHASLIEDDNDQPYVQMPAEVALRALLTHELAHALATHSSEGRQIGLVDQEYIAASMEMELMDEKWRDVFLGLNPVDLPPKEELIHVWIYGMSPRKFAVNAWQHFQLQENGCELIQRLVEGKQSFSKAVRPDLR